MEWIEAVPAKPGYYWTRGPSNVPELVQVMSDFRVCRPGDRTRYRMSDFGKWWCGPLVAPRQEAKPKPVEQAVA